MDAIARSVAAPALTLARTAAREVPSAIGRRNPGLDAARALAILLVFGAHVGGLYLHAWPRTAIAFIYAGGTGVELFFSLSGFLIGRMLIGLARDGLRPPAIGRFLVRRWLRTLPLYYAALLFICWQTGLWDWRPFLFLQNFSFFTRPQALIVSWSLVLEEYFYFFFPFLMLAVAAATGWRGGRVAAAVACGLIVICGCARLAGFLLGVYGRDPTFHVNPILRLDCAAWGVLAACLLQAVPERLRQLFTGRVRLAAWVAAVLAATLCLGALFVASFNPAWVRAVHYRQWSWIFLPLNDGYLNAIFAVLVVALALGVRLPPRGIATATVGWLSRLSYSIYLVHVPLMVVLLPRLGFLPAPARIVLFSLAVLATSAATYAAIEQPFLALRDRFVPG